MSKASNAFMGAAAGLFISGVFFAISQPIHRPASTGPMHIYVNGADCNSAAAKAYVADVTAMNKAQIAAGRLKVSCVQPTQITSTP